MTRWWATACVLVVALAAACTPGEDSQSAPATLLRRTPSTTLVVEGQRVDAELTESVAALCLAKQQASTDPQAAKATYAERSRVGTEKIRQALQSSYAIQAASIAEATAVVEDALGADPPRPTLSLHLELLTASMREGLALLGIDTSPCKI